MTNKRNQTIDILRGIAILSILVGHLVFPFQIRSFFYSYHIFLFFIFTGIFIEKSAGKYSLWEYGVRRFKTIMLPFFIALLVRLVIINIRDFNAGEFALVNEMKALIYIVGWGGSSASLINGEYSLYLWFLPVFFLFSLGIFFVYKYLTNYRIYIFVLSVIFSIIFYYAARNSYYSPHGLIWNIDKLPFMVVIAMVGEQIWLKIREFNDYKLGISMFISGIFLSTSIFVHFDFRTQVMPGVILSILYASAGFIVMFAASKIIEYFDKSEKIKKLLINFGKNTMFLYILHSFVYPEVSARFGNIQDGALNLVFNITAFGTLMAVYFGWFYFKQYFADFWVIMNDKFGKVKLVGRS